MGERLTREAADGCRHRDAAGGRTDGRRRERAVVIDRGRPLRKSPPPEPTPHPSKPPTLNEPKSDAVRPGPVQVPAPNLGN